MQVDETDRKQEGNSIGDDGGGDEDRKMPTLTTLRVKAQQGRWLSMLRDLEAPKQQKVADDTDFPSQQGTGSVEQQQQHNTRQLS